LTVEEWRRQKAIFARRTKVDSLDVGFSTFYLNRCNRSGILSGGLIGGLKQDGEWRMDARFPRSELIRRIEAIAAKAKHITMRNWDAERFMRDYIPSVRHKTLVYCDPPYFHKAERLYLNHYARKDHARIAEVIQRELEHPWVTSYDAVDEVRRLYSRRRSFVYDLHYNANRAYRGAEVFIFSDDLKIPKESALPSVNQGLANIRRSSSRNMS
jgi:DNA adenine methylase